MNNRATTTFDYIVVGGGTAGCILAARLAELDGVDVALIEAGPPVGDDRFILEYRNWEQLIGGSSDWGYMIEPQPRGPATMLASRARLLGGCSSHNATIALRAPTCDLRRWEAMGAAGWGPNGVAAAFARAIAMTNVHEAGPYNPNAEAFMAAARESGLRELAPVTEDVVEGCGWLPMNRRGDLRVSPASAYLTSDRPRVTVMTETLVQRVIIDDHGAAIGVETDRGRVDASNEVILAAGVFNTPQLLMLSGIGPADHLLSVGLPVRHDLPAVGEHLLDHVETLVLFEASRPVVADSVSTSEAAAWISTGAGGEDYDVFIHHVSSGYWLDLAELGIDDPGAVEHAFTLVPYLARPRSEGVVRLRSADPTAPPIIDPRYFSDEGRLDEQTLVEGICACRRLAEQPALRPWVVREVLPGPDVQAFDDLARFARTTANSEYHWVGGCRMGAASDADVVVDAELRVRGIERLRVADASIFPCHVGVNPALTCMMIGEKASEIIGGASRAEG